MPLKIPPELKKITPFVRRAEELEKDTTSPESRLVAYYCRQFSVHLGIPLATSPEGKGCLGEMLGDLEKEKETMSNFTRDEAKFLCRKFSDKVFDKADGEDRAGMAGKNTAKTFYAAATFLEMMQQFYQEDDDSGELQEEKKRIKYAKWKATDILKAMKEGRQPTAGGYGETELEEDEEAETVPKETEESDLFSIPSAPSSAPKVAVETVTDDASEQDDDEPVETLRIPEVEEIPEPEESGMEIELGPPPPAYPGDDEDNEASASLTFTPPTPLPPPPMPMPVVPASKPVPPKAPEKKKAGLFGMGKKKNKLSKADIADATELTRFALSAMEDKDTDLAAERLKQALKVLGR